MIEQKTVDAAIQALEQAKDQEPIRTYDSATEAVRTMQQQIKDLHGRGWSPRAIADLIRDAGIPASVSTIKSVLSDKPKRTRTRRKKSEIIQQAALEKSAPCPAEAGQGLPPDSGNNFTPAS